MNSFGSTYRCPLYDPRGAIAERRRFRRPDVPDLERANSLYCPAGRWPARGWLLVARGDYDQLNKYATDLSLEVGDPTRQDNVGTLHNLAIVQAQCVTRGLAGDLNALYLVEVTDGRGLLSNRWFTAPLTAAYNIRAPAYPQTFMTSSMDGGVVWTWERMVENMWVRLGAQLGAWPGFPAGITPTGTPEGYWFPGVPAWPALCDVLDHLGLTIAADLTNATTPYIIVRPGADDAAYLVLQERYGGATSLHYRLEDDLEWIDVGAARVPATVKVLFRRRSEMYGTEETVYYGNDATAQQWLTTTIHEVSIDSPAVFAGASGVHHIWSDFTVRQDDNGNSVAADVTTAAQIAQARVTKYFATVYQQTLGRMSRTYSGPLPFVTGAHVNGVCWYQDQRHDAWGGWRTSIVRGASPPWSGLWE